jgi:hypothetical protein
MPPKRSDSSLTLIVPDLVFKDESTTRASVLAQFAGRGTVTAVEIEGHAARSFALWELAVLRSCGLQPEVVALPSAPLTRLGQTATLDSHTWAHLEPVHLVAGLNDLAAMQLQGSSRVTHEEHEALTATLNEHLTFENYELQPNNESGWLLRSTRELDATTIAPEHAFSEPLKHSLPTGPQGAELRRLMTEIQMLLHEHPVNRARARGGLPAINAAWLWGLGVLPRRAEARPSLPSAYGHRNFLKGLYLIHGQSIRAQDFTVSSLLEHAQSDALAVLEEREADALDSQWLEPLARAMRRGALGHLHIWLHRWHITVTRGELLRFWRKPRVPAQWSA